MTGAAQSSHHTFHVASTMRQTYALKVQVTTQGWSFSVHNWIWQPAYVCG